MRFRAETDFNPGDECYFIEDEGVLRCRILRKKFEDETLEFELEALEMVFGGLLPSVQRRPGEKFTVSKTMEYINTGFPWQLAMIDHGIYEN